MSADSIKTIVVPDIGGADNVDVIELCVALGDQVEAEQSLLVLETDKASMEIPCPFAGKVSAILVNEGDKISEGDAIFELLVADASAVVEEKIQEPETPVSEAPVLESSELKSSAPETVASSATGESKELDVPVPDIGGASNVDVIEVCVAVGDEVSEGDSLIVLETDKASMEIPAPASGKVLSLAIAEGDKINEGDVILKLSAQSSAGAGTVSETTVSSAKKPARNPVAESIPKAIADPVKKAAVKRAVDATTEAYAGPAARKLARQLGVNLNEVKPSSPRGRIGREDVRVYVRNVVAEKDKGGSGIPAIPEVDFSKFGAFDLVKMSKIKKLTAANMQRNWLNVPHVTQFDDADITELEDFRKSMKTEAAARGTKLTPLPFLVKACAAALRAEPSFNVSLHSDGEHLVQKDYVHIGLAVDTPAGLVVPVVRDADKKGLWQLAEEITALAKKAREGKLLPKEMQGGCFTISSLGAMGGQGFTPIVNAPEVAILGVSKAQMKPYWNGSEFEPRNMLPLSISYDHRAINGADAGRFFTFLVAAMGDIRRLSL